jgi:hypothetical protein
MTRLNTPVIFLIFNRPDTTQIVFNEIRKAQPAQLFIAADGPRDGRPDDIETCQKTREIIQQVDWDCEVFTLFRDKNLGCRLAVSSAIDWFFSQVDEGIILEDDCVPDQSFFSFCQELLERYRDDERIMMISGNNYLEGKRRTEFSYYFSKTPYLWGWASWKRAWHYYDVEMKFWPMIRDGDWLMDIFNDQNTVRYWNRILEDTYNNKIDTWDHQWGFSCWIQGVMCIMPNANLVSNIGFGQEATHTSDGNSPFANMPIVPMQFPLIDPPFIIRDCKADDLTQKTQYIRKKWIRKIRYTFMHMLGQI